MPYPSRKIRRIRVCTYQRPRRKQDLYTVSREDQYAVLEIWYVNILEDIKRGPYSKKPQYAVSNTLDTLKVVRRIKDGHVEEIELEWWFEQDIDVEEKEVEEDKDGGEV
ncbi:hypothetical protein Tco_1270518 [Tanacetum coccineum]